MRMPNGNYESFLAFRYRINPTAAFERKGNSHASSGP
jgi:hypothetical protein